MRRIWAEHPLDIVKLAIGAASNSSDRGPDSLTVLHFKHLRPHGIQFLTCLFNISVSMASIPDKWKNFIIIPILKPRKPGIQGSSYRPSSSSVQQSISQNDSYSRTSRLPLPSFPRNSASNWDTLSAAHRRLSTASTTLPFLVWLRPQIFTTIWSAGCAATSEAV
jgi:hypothetical protein